MTIHTGAASHCLPYDVLIAIPARILQTRDPEQINTTKDARLVHDALLLKFSAAMPFLRSKQIREARIFGAAANIFKAKPSIDAIDLPEWAAEELRRNPAAELWHVGFTRTETCGSAIHALLPKNVVPLLEEYLSLHRPRLAGGNDCDKLFLNKRGGPLSYHQLTVLVGELTGRFANRQIIPAAIRLSFAFKWLSENPNDYFTLSCLLGHKDVRTTIRLFWVPTYLSVSGAMRKFEDWAQRMSKTEEESKN